MATHSSVLAWRIPGMEEPGGLPSVGLHRVGHDWSDLAAAAAGKEIVNNNIDDIEGHVQENLSASLWFLELRMLKYLSI